MTPKSVRKTLKKHGVLMTLGVVSAGEYNPITGAALPVTTNHAIYGFAANNKQSDIDKSLVQQTEMRVYLEAVAGITPKTGDTLTIGADSYSITASQPTPPVGIILLHDVQVSK